MSRSASDATRFTATGPHAYSKPSSLSSWSGLRATSSQPADSSSPGGGGAGSNNSSSGRKETPKEKVERLRAEARAARIRNASSPIDRVIDRGRTWADRAHRVFVFSLIAASGVAGLLVVYSIPSLMMHHRRQRAIWIDKEMERLIEAKKAYVAGSATTEQLELLRREKEGDEEKRLKEELKKQGYVYKAREFIFGGLKQDQDVTAAAAATTAESGQQSSILEAVNAKKAADASNMMAQKPLEKEPSETSKQDGKGSKGGWLGWATGR